MADRRALARAMGKALRNTRLLRLTPGQVRHIKERTSLMAEQWAVPPDDLGANASAWAGEFCRRFALRDPVDRRSNLRHSRDLMAQWFAAAIQAGVDEGFQEGAAHMSHHGSEVD